MQDSVCASSSKARSRLLISCLRASTVSCASWVALSKSDCRAASSRRRLANFSSFLRAAGHPQMATPTNWRVWRMEHRLDLTTSCLLLLPRGQGTRALVRQDRSKKCLIFVAKLLVRWTQGGKTRMPCCITTDARQTQSNPTQTPNTSEPMVSKQKEPTCRQSPEPWPKVTHARAG